MQFRVLAAAIAAIMAFIPASGGPALAARAEYTPTRIELTIQSAGGPHVFRVEVARTFAEQQRGLMFRTDIPADGGMLFAPYPAVGGGPREASFWMENTPSPLDIIFIRPGGTIARIAANAVPFSQERLQSGEPVNAVLEINGGRAAALGIAVGDKVSWQGQGR